MDEFAADPPVEERLADCLRERGETVALAESCTGGLATALLSAVPGASDYLRRATVTYANDAKLDALGVSREALDEAGAVSARVATGMARGARDRAGTDWALAITGIAGPGGGTPEKPVGTVFVGLAHAAPWGTGESYAVHARHAFDGDRAAVREQSARAALRLLEDHLEDSGARPGTAGRHRDAAGERDG